MPEGNANDSQLELAHVLFIDIVGYSKRLINEQTALVKRLNELVLQTEQCRTADAAGKLIRIPTGDGMALAFFTSPDAPVRCAIELSKADRADPKLELRMGIHSGPVDQVSDVNQRSNVAGAGINMAQRVMECGDAGHILLSKHVAEDLEHYGHWQPLLHDLGECEVKHGVRLGVVNLYRDDIGNPQLPKRFQALKKQRTRIRWAGIATALLLLAAIVAAFLIILRKPKSAKSEAYEDYMRGMVNVNSENPADNQAAIKQFEQAIAADRNFAPAYAELSRAYTIKARYVASATERKQTYVDAEVAVGQALALDPNLAEGHFARGLMLWTPYKRFPHEQAIQSYRRAIELNPNFAEAHHQLGFIYVHIGLLDKGQLEIEKALSIDPGNTLARYRLGVINMCRAKYAEAFEIFNSTPLEQNPELLTFYTSTALLRLGRNEEAAALVERYFKDYSTDKGGMVTSVKAMMLAKAGKKGEADATIQHAIEIGRGYAHFHHTSYNIASAYALMNEPEQAMKWLQVTADEGFPNYPLFEGDAQLNKLRNDPRFIAFMAHQKQQWEHFSATL
jgi:tetratricopeptide (TPR) repeat protein